MSEEQLVNIRDRLTHRNKGDWLNNLYVLIGMAGLLVHVCFALMFTYFDITILAYLNIFSISAWLFLIRSILKDALILATWIGTAEILIHSTVASSILGVASGFYLYLWPLALWLTYSPHLSYQKIGIRSDLCPALNLFNASTTQRNE